jgi:lipoprotein NlpI
LVAGFAFGVSECAERFAKHNVDISVLRPLTAEDLKEIRVSPGHQNRHLTCCEAQFYIGEWHLLRGNNAAALAALQTATAACSKDFDEYTGARAELQRLKP